MRGKLKQKQRAARAEKRATPPKQRSPGIRDKLFTSTSRDWSYMNGPAGPFIAHIAFSIVDAYDTFKWEFEERDARCQTHWIGAIVGHCFTLKDTARDRRIADDLQKFSSSPFAASFVLTAALTGDPRFEFHEMSDVDVADLETLTKPDGPVN